jgi:ATP-dependent DNA helicase RecG
MYEIEVVSADQADRLTKIGEGQFGEVKATAILPSKLSRTISAFANADGGELYVGISEEHIGGGAKNRFWYGFRDVEAANDHVKLFDQLFPLGRDFHYSFLRCEGSPGLILHVQVSRTQGIMKASDKIAYVRRGAQNVPLMSPEEIRKLEYAKGITSFEKELTNVPKDIVVESPVTAEFLAHVVPSAEPEPWLRKQALIQGDNPTVAAVLLFAEEPQAVLPKRCGIKIYRYKTRDAEGFRDVLDFTPKTVEGCLAHQIREAVRVTTEITESIPRLGADSLESIKYPQETLHEIITNALIHRDYNVADDVHIRIFDNRVEVQSPGRLPAHITVKNILNERFARNGAIVRLLNKFPDPPNKDVGEGLNTAFARMNQIGLKEPVIEERDNDVLVFIRHEPLASPEEAIMKYLETHPRIKNKEARQITHIRADYQMKSIFKRMEEKGLIRQVEGTRTSNTAYEKVN